MDSQIKTDIMLKRIAVKTERPVLLLPLSTRLMTHTLPGCLCLIYDLINHKQKLILSFPQFASPLCCLSHLLPHLRAPSSVLSFFQKERKTFHISSHLSGSFLARVVCGGSMERLLVAPRQIPDYAPQLRL